jgi:hypothetical protein
MCRYQVSVLPSVFRWYGYEDIDIECSLAYAELFLTLAGIVRRFDFELFETTFDDVKIDRDAFVAAARVGSKGVRVVVKGEAS